jgi:hypothetical protein
MFSLKNIVVIILIVAIGGGLYFSYQYLNEGADEAIRPQMTVSSGSGQGATYARATQNDFLDLLTAVRRINFDSSIFHDPIFLGLENFQQPLPEREVGRSDPFAPIR